MTLSEPGPVGSFDDCFAERARVAHRVACRLTGSRPDAEDITQEALAPALARWRRVREPGTSSTRVPMGVGWAT